MKVKLNPFVLKWARERAKLNEAALAKKIFGARGTAQMVKDWETSGEVSFNWAEKIAEKTHTAFGFLFLDRVPKITLPVQDFRTLSNDAPLHPSAELLDVLHNAQLRQNWFREYLIAHGEAPLPFVGEASTRDSAKSVAFNIRRTLGIGPNLTTTAEKWETAFRDTIEAIESSGILFLRTGYAFGYTGSKLQVNEFRGFALSDEYAPLIFINGADAPNAQMFTLAHELAHIWLGLSGVSNLSQTYASGQNVEEFCNSVAAEVLLPMEDMKASWRSDYDEYGEILRLSKKYKISNLVVARRAHDAGYISKEKFNSIFSREYRLNKKSGGGDYYTNEQYQNSKRLSVALIRETREGRTLFHDAMKLLGIKKNETFAKYIKSLNLEMA